MKAAAAVNGQRPQPAEKEELHVRVDDETNMRASQYSVLEPEPVKPLPSHDINTIGERLSAGCKIRRGGNILVARGGL